MSDKHYDIVETVLFHKAALELLTEKEYQKLLDTLSQTPTAGAMVPKSGGARKVRVAMGNKGKSGGARVIYYFTSKSGRVYLIDIFAKKNQENLTNADLAALKELVKTLE